MYNLAEISLFYPHSSIDFGSSAKGKQRKVSVNPTVLQQRLKSVSSKSVENLPLSKDTIETITTFCFPGMTSSLLKTLHSQYTHFSLFCGMLVSRSTNSLTTFRALIKWNQNDLIVFTVLLNLTKLTKPY